MADEKPVEEEPKVDLLGQLSVELGGATYKLRPSRLAITNIEQLTGKPLLVLAAQGAAMMLPLSEMGICIAEMMRAYGLFDETAPADYKAAKAERCADLVYESDPLKIQNRLSVIFKNAVDGGYTAAGEPRPARGTMTTEPTLSGGN